VHCRDADGHEPVGVVIEPLCAKQRDGTYCGRLGHEQKKLQDPQDVLVESDLLRQQLKKRPEYRGLQRRSETGSDL